MQDDGRSRRCCDDAALSIRPRSEPGRRSSSRACGHTRADRTSLLPAIHSSVAVPFLRNTASCSVGRASSPSLLVRCMLALASKPSQALPRSQAPPKHSPSARSDSQGSDKRRLGVLERELVFRAVKWDGGMGVLSCSHKSIEEERVRRVCRCLVVRDCSGSLRYAQVAIWAEVSRVSGPASALKSALGCSCCTQAARRGWCRAMHARSPDKGEDDVGAFPEGVILGKPLA